MDDLNAEMEVLQSLTTSRTPRFTAINDLPLERHASVEVFERFGGPQAQNQYFCDGRGSDTRSDFRGDSNEFLQAQFSCLAQVPGTQLGGLSFPLQSEAVFRGGDFSAWPIGEPRASYESVMHGGFSSPHQSVPSPYEQRNDAVVSVRKVAMADGKSSSGDESPGQDRDFEVNLVHAGQTVRQRVHEHMLVGQLAMVAAGIFSLDPHTVVLMLFGMTPLTLDKMLFLRGPPRVGPNSTVMVFVVPRPTSVGRTPDPNRGGERSWPPEATRIAGGPSSAGPPTRMHSKLLGTFKLPKIDGAAKNWKQWDRDFVRFLGLHQLEHVLLEDFPQLLPDPEAVASNKIVYFLVEEAVLPGTLASKYVRQAPLWDGHGAYVLLYNGFVFSGPQTATVLMAELSNIRFHAGETGSAFCLRLVELLEDLEHIPGTSAVCLNNTQKLGYLLSAIRHERDLNGVYVQLQTDQLRGKVTFEQACQELHFRCEAIRADALLDSRYKPTGKALISTEIKHLDKPEKLPCLVKNCEGMIVAFLPLCKGCFLQCKSGKTPVLELRDGLGNATYNAKTEKVEFPPGVPKSRCQAAVARRV
jgi:hypothetical protein